MDCGCLCSHGVLPFQAGVVESMERSRKTVTEAGQGCDVPDGWGQPRASMERSRKTVTLPPPQDLFSVQSASSD